MKRTSFSQIWFRYALELLDTAVVIVRIALAIRLHLSAGDWPQWGGTPSRCGVSDAKNLPSEWNVGEFDAANRPLDQ